MFKWLKEGTLLHLYVALAQVYILQNIGYDPLLVPRYALIKPQILVRTIIVGKMY